MIKKIIIYIVITTLLLYGFRYLHYKGLLRQTQGYYAKYNTCFTQSNTFNVIFLGSSRAEMHYDTHLYDSLTGKNSFNLSMAGANPELAFTLLNIYLQKSKAPEFLFYEIDLHNLKSNHSELFNFNNYFPFLSDPYIRNAFTKIDQRMSAFYYNPYYSFPFTGIENLSTSLHGWMGLPNASDHLYYKGFLKDSLHATLAYQKEDKAFAFVSSTNCDYLDSLILLCKQRHIQLAFITSPVFAGGKLDLLNKDQVTAQIRRIVAKQQINYYDFSSMPFCKQRELFVDHHHMNGQGARIFIHKLVDFFGNKREINSLN